MDKRDQYACIARQVNGMRGVSEKQNKAFKLWAKEALREQRSYLDDIEYSDVDYREEDVRRSKENYRFKDTGEVRDRYRYSRRDYEEREPIDYDDDGDPIYG